MMGTAQFSLEVPVTRGTSGLLLFTEGEIPLVKEGPCIRCGRCVRVCPARIMPTTIAAYARLDMMEEAEHFHAMDCIECGCCTYTCPAAIPLVQALRHAKAAILAKRRKI
jgi:Na+-translocating ferredoxin:NAD+ oxidoreductase subunit C